MGFTFSSDGSKMFITGRAQDKVQEFNLSTPFDLSNVSKTGIYSIATQIDSVAEYHSAMMVLKCLLQMGVMMLIKKMLMNTT